ncbi:MAG: 4Fe-4S dicluster domain-containing protein [Anaerolineae bacterium]|nr:4Fe-4S dicluster domain-containing protein [Anaerolineae bacterium]
MVGAELHPFLVEVMATRGGANVLQCYQCGTCSGSCPVLEEMTHGPRRILYMIQNGMEQEVLSSPDIWRCVSCYSCMNRCPRDIEITDLMADLRRLAIQKGYVEDKEAVFGRAFAETVAHHGRLFEPELLTRYYLRTWDVVSLIGMIPLGLKMLVKNKLPFVPESIQNPADLEKVKLIPPVIEGQVDVVNTLVSWMITVLGFVAALGLLITGQGSHTFHIAPGVRGKREEEDMS